MSEWHPRHNLEHLSVALDITPMVLRATLFFATRPLSLADVEFLDWAPYLEVADPRAGNEGRR